MREYNIARLPARRGDLHGHGSRCWNCFRVGSQEYGAGKGSGYPGITGKAGGTKDDPWHISIIIENE